MIVIETKTKPENVRVSTNCQLIFCNTCKMRKNKGTETTFLLLMYFFHNFFTAAHKFYCMVTGNKCILTCTCPQPIFTHPEWVEKCFFSPWSHSVKSHLESWIFLYLGFFLDILWFEGKKMFWTFFNTCTFFVWKWNAKLCWRPGFRISCIRM